MQLPEARCEGGGVLRLGAHALLEPRDGRSPCQRVGEVRGLDLQLGRTYACGLTSTIALGPLQDMKFLIINYGQAPFKYTLPDGYRALNP